jgi:hypothetical protein
MGLTTTELLERGGGRPAYRRYVQQHVTRGEEPEGYEDFGGRVALGSREFLEKAKGYNLAVKTDKALKHQIAHIEELLVSHKQKAKGAKFSI